MAFTTTLLCSKIIDIYQEKVPHSIKYQEKYRHAYYIDLIYSK